MTSRVEHLSAEKIVNYGSFYTPEKFVLQAVQWLRKHGLNDSYTIADTSCGYGAFFYLRNFFPHNKYIGNDIDATAVETAKRNFPFIVFFHKNALKDVDRSMFHLGDEHLCLVGNPPYNDTTSQIGRNVKTDRHEIDEDLFTRDLGLSFLKSYAKLDADFVLILHPLSYLIKKTNFSAARMFFHRYSLAESIVFSSHEFEDTSRSGEFPIIMALYKKAVQNGLTFEKVKTYSFQTLEGESFSLDQYDYLSDYISKYPHSRRYTPEILFYTMRDINALKRSRTFIKERCANAVDVDPAKIAYYCYADLFKRYAVTPYWMGNFDIPFQASIFSSYADAVVTLSKSLHPEIFGKTNASPQDEVRVKEYLERVLNTKE